MRKHLNDVLNTVFYGCSPRVQGFMLGVCVMTLAAVIDSLIIARSCS